MGSVGDIFDLLGGVAEVGRIIGKRAEHVGSMKARGSIPVVYWPDIIAAAKERGIDGITSESLTSVHATAMSHKAATRVTASEAAQ